MITVNFPTERRFLPGQFDFGVSGPALIETSPTVGAMTVTPPVAPRWVCTLGFEVDEIDNHPALEALVAQLGGQRALLSMWHLIRPVPRGTLRGTPSLAGAVAQGATTAAINCSAGETILRGDMLKIGSQVVMATADAQESSGTIVVSFANPSREVVNSGAAVTWDRPRITWISQSSEVFVPYTAGFGEPFSMSFVEYW